MNLVQPEEYELFVSCHRPGNKVEGKSRLLIGTISTPDLAQAMHGYGAGYRFILIKGGGGGGFSPDFC